jgi:dimeric dUTPase (all-alpha-NTP-PPase superfamily)
LGFPNDIYKMTRVGEQIFDVIYPELSNYHNKIFSEKTLALRKRIVELASKEECIKHLINLVVCFARQNHLKSVIFSSLSPIENKKLLESQPSEHMKIKVNYPFPDVRSLRVVEKFNDEIIFEDIAEFLKRIPLE